MNRCFADTWFFLALLDEHDSNHAKVAEYAEKEEIEIVTTRWVLVETANSLARSQYRNVVASFLKALETDAAVQIVDSKSLYGKGLQLFADRPDKSWSLTDCITFVVMGDLQLQHALTGDRHFSQAGFVPVFG